MKCVKSITLQIVSFNQWAFFRKLEFHLSLKEDANEKFSYLRAKAPPLHLRVILGYFFKANSTVRLLYTLADMEKDISITSDPVD